MSTTSGPHEPTPSGDGPASVDPTLVDHRARGRGRRRRWWIGGAAAVVVVAVATTVAVNAAGRGSANAEGTAPAGAGTTAFDPNATVTVGLTLEPTNLDIRTTSGAALNQALIDNVYQGLVSRTPDGKIVPRLATSWSVSPDARTYTFTLNAGAKFSNGDALTSQAVVASLKDVIDHKLNGSDRLAPVQDVTAPDERTVVVTLKNPYPDLLWALSEAGGLVLDPAATNDRKTTATGSGPYLVSSWKQGDSITLTRNDKYWGADKAKVAKVVLRYITDPNAAVNAVNSGDLDVLAPVTAQLRQQITNKAVTLTEGDATDKFVLAFNNKVEPLSDVRVREAIRYAIDHEALVKARGGVDALLGGPIAPGDPGYRDLTGLFPHDPAKAKALIAEAGYGQGLKLELTIPSFYGTTFPDLLTSQLAAVGITLTTKSVDFPAWLQDVYKNHDYQLSIVDHAESHDFNAWANPAYYFGYDNPTVRDLYGQAQTAANGTEQDARLAQAAEIVSRDAAADWLTNFRTVTAIRKGVEGFPTSNINARLDLTDLRAEG